MMTVPAGARHPPTRRIGAPAHPARVPSSSCVPRSWLRPSPRLPRSGGVGWDRARRSRGAAGTVACRALGERAVKQENGASALDTAWRKANVAAIDLAVRALGKIYGPVDDPDAPELPWARFYVLETVARVPYFSYLSVLHLYETLGLWRKTGYLRIHFAEADNETHHLLIMEELGGGRRWADRFLAQHAAVAYFWVVTLLYLTRPAMAYHLNEQVEGHAFETYDKFIGAHGERLSKMRAPRTAVTYYEGQNPYLFDEFQTSGRPGSRRPSISNLRDAIAAVRQDEAEHTKTMRAMQFTTVRSPHDNTPVYVDEDEGIPCSSAVDCAIKSWSE